MCVYMKTLLICSHISSDFSHPSSFKAHLCSRGISMLNMTSALKWMLILFDQCLLWQGQKLQRSMMFHRIHRKAPGGLKLEASTWQTRQRVTQSGWPQLLQCAAISRDRSHTAQLDLKYHSWGMHMHVVLFAQTHANTHTQMYIPLVYWPWFCPPVM